MSKFFTTLYKSDYYKMTRYGTNEDYKEFGGRTSQKKNLMDYVTNHWGSKTGLSKICLERLDSLLGRAGKWFQTKWL